MYGKFPEHRFTIFWRSNPTPNSVKSIIYLCRRRIRDGLRE